MLDDVPALDPVVFAAAPLVLAAAAMAAAWIPARRATRSRRCGRCARN